MSLSIPSGVIDCTIRSDRIGYIYVDEANQTFKSVDGALYTKDGKELVLYPYKESKDLVISEGTETIWYNAMSKLEVETISLPSTLKYVNIYVEDAETMYQKVEEYLADVLPGSEMLRDVYVSEDNENIVSVDGIVYSKDMKRLVFCPRGKDGEITVDERTEIIGHIAFSESRVTKITLPEGLTSIEYSAFSNCTNLTELNIPKGVTEFNKDMFWKTALKSLTFPEDSPYISENGIVYSKDKTELLFAIGNIKGKLVIPEGVTSIGESAFELIDTISEVEFPKSLVSIGDNAFSNMYKLESLTIEGKVSYTGHRVFDGTGPELKNIILGCDDLDNGMDTIDEACWFSWSPSISNITLKKSITTIKAGAFGSLKGITSLTIPENVTTIENPAFYNWTSSQTINVTRYSSSSEATGYMSGWNGSATVKWKGQF